MFFILRIVVLCCAIAASGALLAEEARRDHAAPGEIGGAATPSHHRGPSLRFTASGPATASIRFVIEEATGSFGTVQPGSPREIRDAAVIRVFSEQPWVLKLTPRGPSAVTTAGDGYLPMARLAWRNRTSSYQPLRDTNPVLLEAGGPTGPAGREVRVDLRVAVEDHDPLGALALELRVSLEAR